MMIRMILMGAILILLLLLILKKGGVEAPTSETRYVQTPDKRQVVYWPAEHNQLVHYSTHSLSYNPEHRQADWVAYILTSEDFGTTEEIPLEYTKDPDMEDVAHPDDYLAGDYVMGQLISYEERSGHPEGTQEIFYMSNVSPQKKGFNQGVWRELKENVRDWTHASGRLYIVTGPVLNDELKKVVDSQVSVPDYFFKVILDLDSTEPKMLGFLIPNEETSEPLESFAQTVSAIEELTQIDFFKSILLDQKLEESLEGDFDMAQWPVDQDRYQRRVERWHQIKSKE